MTIEEYSKFTAVCEDCGSEMNGAYEAPAVKGSDCHSGPGGGSSCGDGCGGCSGCGCGA